MKLKNKLLTGLLATATVIGVAACREENRPTTTTPTTPPTTTIAPTVTPTVTPTTTQTTPPLAQYTVSFTGEGVTLPDLVVSEGSTVGNVENPERSGFTFVGWVNAATGEAFDLTTPISSNITLEAKWEKNIVYYTVSFNVEGTIQSSQVEENTTISAPQDPEKEGYRFLGWYTSITAQEAFDFTQPISGNVELIARFEEVLDEFTVRFIIDGQTVESVKVTEGELVALPSINTTQEGKNFLGWFESGKDTAYDFNAAVTGDVTLTAKYETIKYTITFQNWDGTVLQSSEVEYGKTPSFTGTPVREGNAQYSYTFTGWDKEITSANNNETYIAQYSESVNTYTVTFLNWDGTVLKTSNVAYGETPEYTGTPTRPGNAEYTYTFAGWDNDVVAVTGNATYQAKFDRSVNKYTITFKNYDGTILEELSVEYGLTPECSVTPTREATAQYSYVFKGWNKDVQSVTEEATYIATYSQTLRSYTVKFVNWDGTLLQSLDVEYGIKPSYTGETPTKSEEGKTFIFAGWDKIVSEVTGEVTYTAQFTENENKYTVTWVVEGVTVETDLNVVHGSLPQYDGATPTKAGNAQYSYNFTGWDKELSPVTENITYTAQFEELVNEYTITWVVEGVTVETDTVAYGETPTYDGETPTIEATAQYTYTFTGWGEVSSVTGNATYEAQFERTVNQYTVTWVVEGETVETDTVDYGTLATYDSEAPTKAGNAQYTYTFTGWDQTPSPVTGNVTYTAVFAESVNTYQVVFKDEDGTVLKTYSLEYGKMPSFEGTTPSKPSTAQYSYEFAGWNNEFTVVESNQEYVATYTESINTYTVTFQNENGEVLDTQVLPYGQTPEYNGIIPTKESTNRYDYEWNPLDGWTTEISSVTGDVTYTAKFEAVTRKFTVTWIVDGNAVEVDRNVEYGIKANYDGETPTRVKEGYTCEFIGWDTTPTFVTGDVTYTAVFSEVINKYTVTWACEGNVIHTDLNVEHGSVVEYDGVTPTKAGNAQYSYNFTGWDKELSVVTGNVTYNAVFEEVVNTYTVTFKNYDGSILEEQTLEYGLTPVYNGTPQRADDEQYSYTFTGWNTTITSVTGNVTYIAQFTPVVHTYTVTWIVDGNTSEVDYEVAYGTLPTYDKATPSKAATAQYSYTFKGWDNALNPVTGDITFTAVFESTVNKYTITFQNWDGTVLQSSEVEYGTTPQYLAAEPTKSITGYTSTFTGWGTIESVTGDATYVAQFDDVINTYTVTWIVNGETVETDTVEHGAMASYDGVTPTKEATAQYTYTFAGWDKEISVITGNVEYVAVFNETVNTYTVTWMNGNEVLATDTVEYGQIPSYNGATPSKTVEGYTCTFVGWDVNPTAVTGNVTYTAVFDEELNTYTVTFETNGANETIESVIVNHNGTVTAPEVTRDGFELDGWYVNGVLYDFNTPITSNLNIYAKWTAISVPEVNIYTVTFMVDGQVSSMSEIEENQTVLQPANPSKVGHTFDGWYLNGTQFDFSSPITGDIELVARFTAIEYTITFQNWDGQVLQTIEVAYGETPSYTGVTPTREATAQYTYTFAGWTTKITEVTGQATYTAKFNQTVNTYTVKWMNGSTLLETDLNVEYGTTPQYNGTTPTKAATAQYSYVFNGWTTQISPVTGDVTYEAQFESYVNSYTITFKNWNGSVLQSSDVEYGQTPVYNGTPSRPADQEFTYTFAGWDVEITPVTGEATYTAKFDKVVNTYTITFKNFDGTVLQTLDVEYGLTPTYTAATPTREATTQYTYTFAGWNKTLQSVTEDATYVATFNETVNSYTVTFQNWDGTQLQSTSVKYGVTPEYNGETPTKAGNAQYSYTFTGWDSEISQVTGNVVYTAVFTESVNTYTITWVVEGVTVETDTVAYGETPEFNGTTPSKAATAEFTYTFAGWGTVESVTGNRTYEAQFDATVNQYTVTWIVDGETVETDTVDYGTLATYDGETPSREATAQYTYTFAGWDQTPSTVTGNITYTATFNETVNTYTITWVVEGETVEVDTNVAYGAMPTYNGETPTKTADGKTYTFVGWGTVTSVTGDATYTAIFTESTNTYTVTWVVEGVTVETDLAVVHGANPEYNGATPTKAGNAQYSYNFTGWDQELSPVTGNITYTAQFKEVTNEYTVTWVVDGETVETDVVPYGTMASYDGAAPTKDGNAQYSYNFTGWDKAISSVTGNVTYTAMFEQVVNTYTITWVVEGETVKTDTVEYGKTPQYTGAAPTKEGNAQFSYTFAGWGTIESVTGDATYTAVFTESVNSYQVVFKDEDGTVLKTYTVAYGETPSYDGTTPSKAATAQYTYTFAGWNTEISAVQGNQEYVATYAQTINKYTVTWVVEGVTVETDNVEYGTMATYDGATPTKAGNAQYSYNFTGWDQTPTTVTGNITYTARFEQVTNVYTVTWVVEGVTVETDINVAYGTMPTFNGQTPTKTGNAQYSYTFAGWGTITTVTGDVTYTAQFTETVNTYTVTWVVDGQTVETDTNVAYGETPSYDGATPTKAATAQYSYTFAGWGTISSVTGNVTYTAQFTETVNEYTVTFNVDGVKTTQTVKYGNTVERPQNPTVEGSTFSHWTLDGLQYNFNTPITGNIELIAVWAKNSYSVTFVTNGGNTIDSQTVQYGGAISNVVPTRTGYTFAGWYTDAELTQAFVVTTPITGNTTLYAAWDAIEYTVTFNIDGTISNQTVEYGKTVAQPSNPSKNGYTFDGWFVNGVEYDFSTVVTGDIIITAQFTQINQGGSGSGSTETITVTYDSTNYNGLISGNNATYGSVSTWTPLTAFPSTIKGTVLLIPAAAGAEGTLTVTCNSARTDRPAYLLASDGSQTSTSYNMVKNPGQTESFTADNIIEYNGNYYVAISSAADFKPISITISYTGGAAVTKYDVNYNYNDGVTPNTTEKVVENGTATKPADPTREGYNFLGWYLNGSLYNFSSQVTSGITLTAMWEAIEYTVTFVVDGQTYQTQTVGYNQTISAITEPTKDGYIFMGWLNGTEYYDASEIVTSDLTLVADFYEKPSSGDDIITQTITFNTNGGSQVESQVVTFGSYVQEPVEPTKTGFTFDGWYTDAACTTPFVFTTKVVEDMTLYAKWVVVTYTVTFDSNGGSDVQAQEVNNGQTVTMPNTPTKQGYIFLGWFVDDALTTEYDFSSIVLSDITLHAKWYKEGETMTIYHELIQKAGLLFNDDFDNYGSSDRLPFWGGWTSEAGIYESNTAGAASSTAYVGLGSGAGSLVDSGDKNETKMFLGFGQVITEGKIEGVLETTFSNQGNSWTPFQVHGYRSGTTSVAEIFGIRIDGGIMKYRIDGADSYVTPETSITSANGTMYEIYYMFDMINKTLTVTVNGNPFVTNLAITADGVAGVALTSSNSGNKTQSIDHVAVVWQNFSNDEYRQIMVEKLQNTYDSYNVPVKYPSIQTEMEALLAQGLAAINSATTQAQMESSYNSYVARFENEMLDVEKANLKAQLENYVDASDYTINASQLSQAIASGKSLIDAAQSLTNAQVAYAQAKAAIDAIENDELALITLKANAVVELQTYKNEADYTVNAQAYAKAISDGTALINAATSQNGVNQALVQAKALVDAVKNDAQVLAENKVTYANMITAKHDEYVSLLNQTQHGTYITRLGTAKTNAIANINSASTIAEIELAYSNGLAELELIYKSAIQSLAEVKATALADLEEYYNTSKAGYEDPALLTALQTVYNNGRNNINACTDKDSVITALAAAKQAIADTIAEFESSSEDVIIQKGKLNITDFDGVEEAAYCEWEDYSAATGYKIYLKGGKYTNYTEVDEKIAYVTEPDSSTTRVDLLGLTPGGYSIKITPIVGGAPDEEAASAIRVTVLEYDRSGYAHFNYTEGIGAYNDDGTLKDNAIVLYVSDANKNTVSLSHNGKTVTGIGNILNTNGKDNGSGTNAKGGLPNTNQDILKDLANANIPLVVRFFGVVSNTGLYKQGSFNANSTPLIDGLTHYDSVDYGGSVGDNGHMARISAAKDLTLEGIGARATIDGFGFHFIANTSDVGTGRGKNFEVRNLVFINTPEDAVGMEGQQEGSTITAGVERCWVHDNEFYCPSISSPAESDKSEGDGSVDFKRGQYFTCSYNYFEGCHKTNLVGSSDSSLQYNITYHHNYWKECGARGPLARNANIHMYNNIYEGQNDYAQNPRANAFIFSEYNMFYKAKNPSTVASGGVVKSYNDSFASYISDRAATIVTSKTQAVSNSCKYAAEGIDYSQFELDSKLSYIPTSDYNLHENFTELRKDVVARAGAQGRISAKYDEMVESDWSVFESLGGVNPITITTLPYEAAPGKVSKSIYAFKVNSPFNIEATFSGGVLVNAAGEALAFDSCNLEGLEAGTYAIQPMNFGNSSFTASDFKGITISSVKITEGVVDELTKAKNAAIAELEQSYPASNYTQNRTAYNTAYNNGVSAIKAATSEAGVTTALNNAKSALAGVKTDTAILTEARSAAVSEVNSAAATLVAQCNASTQAALITSINTIRDTAITNINNSTSTSSITTLKDTAITNMNNTYNDAVLLDQIKSEQAAVVNSEANRLIGLLDASEDAAAIAEIRSVASTAVTNINNATTSASVTSIADAAIAEITAIYNEASMTIADYRNAAIADLRTYAQGKISAYPDLNDQITTELNNGISAINRANTSANVTAQLNAAKEAIDNIIAENSQGTNGQINITKSVGDRETAILEWDKLSSASAYNVYYKKTSSSTWTQIDDMLVREYPNYIRADAVGLEAGEYEVKVAPVISGTEAAASSRFVTVEAHDRAGYAFVGGSSSGAYNDNGTLKSNAKVVYVTEGNKNSVSLQGLTGVQNIILGMKSNKTINYPVCIRLIGNITDPATLDKGDLLVDAATAGLTIEGIGNDAVVNGFGIRIKNSSNVEIRNFATMNVDSSEGDNIGLQQGNNHVWVHNIDLFYGHAGGDADQAKGDGALDTKTSTNITHSYNHFWDTGKSNLQGMKSESTSNTITYHHNWYDHSDSRHPRIRTCTVHIYNNLFDGVSKYGVGVTMGSSAFVENNYFLDTKTPMMSSRQGTDALGDGTFSGEAGGMIKSYGNEFVFKNTSLSLNYIKHTDNATSFDAYHATSRNEQVPSSYKTLSGGTTYSNFDTASGFYSYDVETASEAKETVRRWAGRVEGGDFTWDFSNLSEDTNYAVNTELKSALMNYKTTLVKVLGNGETVSGGGSTGGDSGNTGGSTGGDSGNTGGSTGGGTVLEGGTVYAMNSTSVPGFTITGNTSSSKGSNTYNGTTYSTCIKMESSTSIQFTLDAETQVILVFASTDTGKRVKIDGTTYTTDSNGYVTATLAAGSHTITKGDSIFIFAIVIGQSA